MLQLWRIIVAGTRNFVRNAWLSSAATAVMTVTLTLIMLSFISNLALTATIKGVTDKIDVSIFLKNDTTPTQIDSFQQKLRASGNVDSLTYISPDQAVKNFKETNKDKPDIIAALEQAGNALPSSIQIKAKDPQKLDAIETVVNQPENKALLDPEAAPSYSGKNKDTINKIVRFSDFFRTAGLGVSAIFLVISTLIIFNTIRMAIFTRRDEIEIMKLVGATKWFIRGPFVFEAALYGMIAAIIATLLTYSILFGGATKIAGYIDFSTTLALFSNYAPLIIAAEFIIGLIIGACSSLLAMSRYLKL